MLYVVDGRIATSAGIASGIDLALHLIAVRDGPAVAARVAREMVVYARRNGDEQQASAMLRHRNHLSDSAHRAQDSIESRFAGPLPLAELASDCGVSERTLTRRFVAATGMTPLRYQQVLRVERAEHLIGHGATVEAAARAVGFRRPHASPPARPPASRNTLRRRELLPRIARPTCARPHSKCPHSRCLRGEHLRRGRSLWYIRISREWMYHPTETGRLA